MSDVTLWLRVAAFRREIALKLIKKHLLAYALQQRQALEDEVRRLEEITRQEELERQAKEAKNAEERARIMAEKLRLEEEER